MDEFTLNKLEFDRLRQILARFCRCSLGSAMAGRIGPSRRAETVRQWLAQTREMVEVLVAAGPPPYGGITDIHPQLARATPGAGATGTDFADIAATLEGAAAVKTWVEALDEGKVHLRGLSDRLHRFDGEVRAIQQVVDDRGEVRDTASPRLAELRGEIQAAQDQIRQIVYEFVRRRDVAQFLQSTTVQMHEDRYVLPLRAEQRGRIPGVVHRASHTGSTLFVEPAECVELNNRLVTLHDKEHAEVTRLLTELAIRVHGRLNQIVETLRTLAQLDLIAAKAQYAYQFEMTCPEITDKGSLQFFQARHPLLVEQVHQQELAGIPVSQRHAVVPIDVRLGQDFDLLVITGSNTGGKTVALKTVGLLVLMAQSGLHVPAQRGATLPVFADVLLDVGDEQSLEQSLSTFGAHLERIKHILRRADRHSLVLLDELGSGTDPDEGGAIGQAVLDELRRAGCLGMITTHLGVLKAYAYAADRVDNASVEFDTATLQPMYKLLIGQPGESHAIVVAEHLGLPRRVIAAARHHLPRQGRQLRAVLKASEAARRASETAMSEAQSAKLTAQAQQELFQAKLSELEKLTSQFSDWLGALPALKAGDEVFVRSLRKTGHLQRLQLSRQIAVVDVENLQVEVPLQELMPDLGDGGVREEVLSLRQRLSSQARQLEADRDEAARHKAELSKAVARLQARRQGFDAWRQAVAKLAVGQEVTMTALPGRGTIAAMDLAAGKVTVAVGEEKREVGLQELFPELGAFVDRSAPARTGGRPPRGERRGRQRPAGDRSIGEEKLDRPIVHRNPASRQAQESRELLLKQPPGSEVYVVPFRKRARLIRIDVEKDKAVVSAGAFEMQVSLADLAPIHEGPTPNGDGSQPGAEQGHKDHP